MKCTKCHFDNTEDSFFCKKCGTKLPLSDEALYSQTKTIQTSPAILDKGDLIAWKYKTIAEVGSGGMGIVYKAEDTKLKRTIALKFLPPELSRHPEAKERFLREAHAAAILDHPNICTIFEAGEYEDRAYIAMAYIEGQSLRDKIAKKPLSIDEALDIAIQVAEGLEEAHNKGIIHRDIKSANIMVTEKGQAKIMDFGLAKVVGESLITREAKTMGTVAYMSPEQARGETVNQRSDIWSLGVVLYEMLSGQLPFSGERETSIMYSIVHEEPKPLKVIKPDVPSELERIVRRAAEKRPESRYSSAGEMRKDLESFRESLRASEAGVLNLRSLLRIARKPHVAFPALIVILALCFLGVWFFSRQAKIHWAKNEALLEIARLAYEGDYLGAFDLASKAEKFIAADSNLIKAWPRFSRTISIHTTPSKAQVELSRYLPTDPAWNYRGQTSVDSLRLPLGRYRLKIKMNGFVDLEAAFSAADKTFDFILSREGQFPPGMVIVPGGEYTLFIPGLDHIKAVKLGDYLIDKFEVTNKNYASFVKDGGYEKREYWKVPFMKDGRFVPWEQAIKEFIDQTGRPGPSTWEAGDYPRGKDDFPVSGICWYEAAAYAQYAEKSLPTIFHWNVAASPTWSADIIPLSNFSSLGPTPVGQYHGVSAYGVYDMAGNVREWCWNDAGDKKYILGGGWNDPEYSFVDVFAQLPWDRSSTNGFRCIKYLKEVLDLAELQHPLVQARRDFRKEKPVSEELFKAFKRLYAYDRAELNPKIESEDRSIADRVMQRISFNAAYGKERVIAILLLPKGFVSPFQTVIYFPGSNVIQAHSSGAIEEYSRTAFDFFLKNGRAVFFPIYKGTSERGDELNSDYPNETAFYRDHVIMWAKDLGRSIDYLETRKDILSDKIAYYGLSWGGAMGAIMPAVEERIKLVMLYVAGLYQTKAFPEADQINFLPRIKVPVLMLNGQYDFYFPVDTSQKPMFDILGTPAEDKRQIIYPSSHFVPRTELIKEVLSWLDKYFGPVK